MDLPRFSARGEGRSPWTSYEEALRVPWYCVDHGCGAVIQDRCEYAERSPERVTQRNGYRSRGGIPV